MCICNVDYQKHNIPSLEDEVWRLCWIAKDGKICERLAEHQIYKVKDFLTVYYLNESVLRQVRKILYILGCLLCNKVLLHMAFLDKNTDELTF